MEHYTYEMLKTQYHDRHNQTHDPTLLQHIFHILELGEQEGEEGFVTVQRCHECSILFLNPSRESGKILQTEGAQLLCRPPAECRVIVIT